MSAVLTAPFGQADAVHAARCANSARIRAKDLGYGKNAAEQFARIAKRDCSAWESPDHCALRIVIPMRGTFAGKP